MNRSSVLVVEPGTTRAVRLAGGAAGAFFDLASWPDLGAAGVGPTQPVALRLPLPVGPGTPFIRGGWQSWSAPVLARLGGPPVPRPRSPGLAPRHPWPVAPCAGDESYDVLVADGFVCGVLEQGALIVARPHRGDLLVVREGPGPHPDVWSAVGDSPDLFGLLLDESAARARVGVDVRDGARRALRGWSSWDAYGPAVTSAVVDDVLGRVDGLLPGASVISIDDGWQAGVGDWDRVAPAFPGGLEALAGSIQASGHVPGLWIAPFIASSASRLVHDRPQWLLREEDGAPVVAMHLPAWGGDAYALDVTRPDVLDWVGATVARLVDANFTYLKLDFLYAAALVGRSAVPAPGDRRLRTALDAVRAAAGADAFLVGCGCPLWPAIGRLDAMRIGPDVSDTLHPAPGHADPPVAACLENAYRSAVLRSAFHGRLWVNDPDAVQLAHVPDRQYQALRLASARRTAAAGEMLFCSDALDDLDEGALALWSELAAVHRRADVPQPRQGTGRHLADNGHLDRNPQVS